MSGEEFLRLDVAASQMPAGRQANGDVYGNAAAISGQGQHGPEIRAHRHGRNFPAGPRSAFGYNPAAFACIHAGKHGLERDVGVLLFGVEVALIFEGAQRSDDVRPRGGRLDDRINITALRGYKWVGEAAAEFGDFFLA